MKKKLTFFLMVLFAAALISCDDSASANGSSSEASAKADTVYVHDTIRVADTLNIRDTVGRLDTVKVRDTLVADTVKKIVRDTVVRKDTVKVKIRDTLTVRDTVKVKIRDTLTFHDTLYKDGCSATKNEDGSVQLNCGETSQVLYEALCGKVPYDAETKICVGGELKDRCGNVAYDKDKEFCMGGRVYGSLLDPRDKKVYRTVAIGEQTWMAENLSYAAVNSMCGGGKTLSTDISTGNCAVYGRLYRWSSAMNLDEKYDSVSAAGLIKSPHQGVCPTGWHIPDNTDWLALYKTLIAERPTIPYDVQMRADSLWRYSEEDGGDGFVEPGQNTVGFNALPAGRTWTNQGTGEISYYDEGVLAYFVSATEMNGGSFNHTAFFNKVVNWYSYLVSSEGSGMSKIVRTSVRCIMDAPAGE